MSSARDALSTKPTLESLITRYRREARQPGASTPELEVRLQNVDYANFAAIYEALREGKGRDGLPVAVSEGKLTQMVGAIMDVRTSGRGEGAQRHLRPMRIREIYFEGGRRREERYVWKEQLLLPYRVPSVGGLAYSVALSAERPAQAFSSDESSLLRVKARVSFVLALTGASELRPTLRWRVDMTVVRQLMGSDAAASLKRVVAQMFGGVPPMSAATFLTSLGLDEAATRPLYRYEVEVEFLGPEEARDAVRPADVLAAAEAVLRLANPEYVREAALQAEVYRVAQYVVKAPGYLRRFQHELGLKRLLPQALAITRADYRAIYPPKGLYVTPKADGRRAVAVGRDGRGLILADELLDGFAPAGAPGADGDTVVDGELVTAADGSVAFYAFDVLAAAGEDVTADGFERRLERMPAAVAALRALGLPVVAKAFALLGGDQPPDLERELRAVHDAKYPYETDGLVFVEAGKPYDETANYKWKPPSHNTIDMLARRAPASVLGKPPFVDRPGHKLHFLFVGINPDMYAALGLQRCPGYAELFGDGRDSGAGAYAPVQFSPSDAPLAYLYQHPDASPWGAIDGLIVEARCAGGADGTCAAAGGGVSLVDWEVTRVREDRRRELASKRYYGNDFYTAELIWLNYVDPFPLEMLWEGAGLDYFRRPKAGVYRAQTAVLSYVKAQRIGALKHAGWVVDVGAGKGQDLGRYLDAEVQHLVALDRDRAALSELVRRKYSFAKRGRAPGRGREDRRRAHEHKRGRDTSGRGAGGTTVHVLAADASAPFGQTLERLSALGLARMTADALVCNLAVHYFLGDVASLRNFIALARSVVKVGGTVVLMALDGAAVHAGFAAAGVAVGGTWDVFEGGARKYSLKRLYSGDALEACGQRIGVLLPFSDGRYYEEFLVNTGALAAEFAARGFSVAHAASAADSIADFSARNRALAAHLTEGDRLWLGLYGELIFHRDH